MNSNVPRVDILKKLKAVISYFVPKEYRYTSSMTKYQMDGVLDLMLITWSIIVYYSSS